MRPLSVVNYAALVQTRLHRIFWFDVFTGLLTFLTRVFIYSAIWRSIFAHAEIGGLGPSQLTAYSAISGLSILVGSTGIEQELAAKVKSGDVVYSLVHPVNPGWMYLGQHIGTMLTRLVVIFVPGMALVIALGVVPFTGLAPLGVAAGAMALGAVLNFVLGYITAIFTLWTENDWGIGLIKTWLVMLLSGQLVPLQFFPGPIRQVLINLPFAKLAHVPATAYLGQLGASDLVSVLLSYCAWGILLALAASLAWKALSRSVNTYGG